MIEVLKIKNWFKESLHSGFHVYYYIDSEEVWCVTRDGMYQFKYNTKNWDISRIRDASSIDGDIEQYRLYQYKIWDYDFIDERNMHYKEAVFFTNKPHEIFYSSVLFFRDKYKKLKKS